MEKNKASWNTKDSIKDRVFSIQDAKVSIPLAWWARVWASLFPCHWACINWYRLKFYNLRWMPAMMFSILIGAYVKSERALALIPLLVGIKQKKILRLSSNWTSTYISIVAQLVKANLSLLLLNQKKKNSSLWNIHALIPLSVGIKKKTTIMLKLN